ncbi:MAG: hypothetical protein FWH38_09150, partial [Treponema sp.]|nr:hypothetical protein [Treponema sp.]
MRKIPVFPLLAALVLLFTLTAPPLPAGENSGYVNGTVKTGDYSQVWQPDWVQLTQKKFAVNPAFVLVTLVIIFSLTGLYAAARGFGALVKKNTAAKGGRRPAARRD